MTFDQADFDVRREWGEQGVRQLAPISDVVIIIDVLSFSTCIDIATGRGAIAFPHLHNELFTPRLPRLENIMIVTSLSLNNP